jgi:hypothetical protein
VVYPVLLVLSGGLTPADIRAALRRSPAAAPAADDAPTLP